MDSTDTSLDALGLSQDLKDEEKSDRLSALITSVVHENHPKYTLEQIYRTLSNSRSASLLDPLKVIPIMLPVQSEAGREIMTLVGNNCSAKEVIIAVQEAVEWIQSSLCSEDDDEENGASLVGQLDSLISLYSSSIIRLRLRNKTASETISPVVSDLEETIRFVPSHSVSTEGRHLVCTVSYTIQNILKWARTNTDNNMEEIVKCKARNIFLQNKKIVILNFTLQEVLHGLLETTVTACIPFIHSSLAQNAFNIFFPRLVVRSVLRPGQEESDKAMQDATDASTALGYSPSALLSRPSIASLVFLAHNLLTIPITITWLSSFLPTILTSMQTNVALDESLAILYHQLTHATDVPQEVLSPLAEVLPSLASVHPDSSTRFLAFRLLAQLLTFAPSQIHLEILRDLTSESTFPQMRTAAIGLVKEAVLEAISCAPSARQSNVFASPLFMRIFSPILFRPSPPSLLSSSLSFADFQDSSEPSRLAESIALLYILLKRDSSNLTGILDDDEFGKVENALLKPLRSFLSSIKSTQEYRNGHKINHSDEMVIAALEMNLERLDSVLG